MSKVKSIVPAPDGWTAVFKDESGEYERRVVLWALVEHQDDPSVCWASSYSVSTDSTPASDDFMTTDDEDTQFSGYRYRPPQA